MAECFNITNASAITFDTILAIPDAQVWYGCSPPSVQYFGFDTIISGRNFDHSRPPHTPDPASFPMWYPGVNFADPVNSINTNVGRDAPSTPMVVIFTASSTAATAIAAAFTSHAAVSSTSIHTVALDAAVFKPLAGDRGDFSSWKASMPDNLRTIIRVSIPSDQAAYESYKTAPFPFVHLTGGGSDDVPFVVENVKRSIGVDEAAEVHDEWVALSEDIIELHTGDGYELVAMDSVGYDMTGLSDDWVEVLANPAATITADAYPAGTRDGTYGLGFSKCARSARAVREKRASEARERSTRAKRAYLAASLRSHRYPFVPPPLPLFAHTCLWQVRMLLRRGLRGGSWWWAPITLGRG